MTNKLRDNTIKSYKTQNRNSKHVKNLTSIMNIYFTSKITPSFFKTYINQ